jgi:hypothetical protein
MYLSAAETTGLSKSGRLPPLLATIVQQATQALVLMEADRLEELALCCADLTRSDNPRSALEFEDTNLFRLREPLRLLECVLFETRANLSILSRLHAMGMTSERQVLRRGQFPGESRIAQKEVHRGDS